LRYLSQGEERRGYQAGTEQEDSVIEKGAVEAGKGKLRRGRVARSRTGREITLRAEG